MRSLELYRDIEALLYERLRSVANVSHRSGQKMPRDDEAKSLLRLLQTIMDIEDNLEKVSKDTGGVGDDGLDLAAARAEIAARLSLWTGHE